MGIAIRRAAERGVTEAAGLRSRHAFSFGRYLDPAHMGFGPLRALNEDVLAPGAAFGDYEVANMDVLVLPLEGALVHQGEDGTMAFGPGDAHRFSAGAGARRVLRNPSDAAPARFLRLWITPERDGLEPGSAVLRGRTTVAPGQVRVIAAANGVGGALAIRRGAEVAAVGLGPDAGVAAAARAGRGVWLHVLSGRVTIDGGAVLEPGDAARITDGAAAALSASVPSSALRIDVALRPAP